MLQVRPLLAAIVLTLAVVARADDAPRTALVSLCAPAKIATLKGDRAANPRIRKIVYWLEIARQQGRAPKAEMSEVMAAVGWGDTPKGDLTAAAMVRNRQIAQQFDCLDDEGMTRLRRGAAPTVRRGPYAGEKLTVDHIIPHVVSPDLDKVLANLELMPATLNLRKGAKIGQRQIDLAGKFLQAGLISEHDHAAIVARRTTPPVQAP